MATHKYGEIKYKMSFDVDKTSLNDLQKSLDAIIVKTQQFSQAAPDYALPYEEAAIAAQDLKNILNNSWNSKLGQLDLTKVKNQLVDSYGSLNKFRSSLVQIGPEGQKVFNQFTQAILNTQTPIKQTSKLINEMAITFKNTIRYGIASSVWNNFTNQIGKAYGYVKNLDQSLNDIRIVSGQSAEQMEKLAIQANKAAQALGATTLDYTKASLIYYQQGLGDQEVAERTNVTIKMANVLGTTASEVSDYMTAIWNNFDKGSQSLEYYADVITALGAATASSSEEIAEGLNKFAAVADTVGLSYEYATSALATVVSQTRQSADIVGTAFKTLFARIQDLEQGNTLDDGTTLGKYAEALQKVGINIKDSSGELKTMNTILDEMGAKWQTLNEAQKVALAQNVAGTRQYTQLIALMDNWDSFQSNLNTATNATGTLAQQQDIYLDSVEAHLNKLSAAWEGLYDSIFDENSIKTVADALTGLVNIANTFVTGLGGGLNSLIYGASLLGEVFSNQVASSLVRVKNNAEQARIQIENINALNDLFKNMSGIDTENLQDPSYENIKRVREQLQLNEKILQSKKMMNEEEQKFLDGLNKNIDSLDKEIQKEEQILELVEGIKNQINYEDSSPMSDIISSQTETINMMNTAIAENNRLINQVKPYQVPEEEMFAIDIFGDSDEVFEHFDQLQEKLKNTITESQISIKKLTEEGEKENSKEIKGLERSIKLNENKLQSLKDVKDAIKNGQIISYDAAVDMVDILQQENLQYQELKDKAQDLTLFIKNNFKPIDFQPENLDNTIKKIEEHVNDLKNSYDQTRESRDKLIGNNLLEGEISNLIRGFSVLSSTISSTVGIISTLNNDSLSGWEKFSSILSVITAQGINLITHWDSVKAAFGTINTKILPSLVTNLGLMTSAEVAAGASATSMWLALLGPVSLVVAAIAAVGVGIYALVKASNAEQDSINALSKAANKLSEQAKETKETLQDLQSSMQNYDEAVKALQACTKGTKEWEEACLKVNEVILEILDKYPELAKINGIVTRDSKTGALSLNNKLYSNYVQDIQTRYIVQKTGSVGARAAADKKQADLDFTNWSKKFNATGIFSQADLQALVDTAAIPAEYTKKINELIQKAKQENKIYKNADVSQLIKDIEKRREQAESISKAQQRATKQIQETSYAIANLALKGDASRTETKLYAQTYENQIENYSQSLEKQFKDKIAINTKKDSNEYQWLIDTLNESLGDYGTYSKAEKENNVVKGWDGEKGVTVHNNNTGEDEEISREQWIRTVASYKTLEYTNNAGTREAAEKAITNIVNAAEGQISRDTADLIQSGEFGNINDLDQKEVEALRSHAEQIKEAYSPIGKESAEEFNQAFDAVLSQEWDITKHAEKLKEQLKATLQEEGEKAANLFGLDAEDFAEFGEYLADIANTTKDVGNQIADSMAEDGDAAAVVTRSILRMNDGIDKLADGWKDWSDVLKKSRKDSEEYWQALKDTQDALGDLLDVGKDVKKYFSDDWIEKHSKDIEAAANGDEKAIDRLRDAAADEIILKISTENNLDQNIVQDLTKQINELQTQIPDIKIGYTINPDDESYSKFLETCQNIIDTASLTKEQANAMFDMMGFNATYETDSQPTKYTVPIYTTYTRKVGETEYNGQKYDTTETWTEQTGTKELSGEYATFGMAVTPEGESNQTPKISGLTKKATGSFNNYSSKNKGGGRPGKSGGSKKEPNKKDPIEANIDRYHKVNTQISKTDNLLKKLTSQEEKLVGKNLLDNLNKQWSLLNTQIDNYNEKLRIANQEQQELASKLAGQGVQFNSDGTVANYESAIKSQEAYMNGLINHYNSLSADAQEKYEKDVLEPAQKAYDKFLEDIDRYDELVSDFIPGIVQSLQDAASEKIELQIKQFNYKFEIRLDLQQAKRDWNDFVNHYIKDNMPEIMANQKTVYDDMGTRIQQNGKGSLQVATNQANQYREQYEKFLRGENNIFSANGITDQATALEKVKEAYEKLIEEVEAVKDAQKQAHENLISQLDESQDKLDQQRQAYSAYASQINHDIKLIELLNDKPNYKQLEKYYQDLHQNNIEELDFLRQQKNMWEEQMNQFEQGSDEWFNARDKYLSSLTELNSKTEEALDNIRKAFENTIESIYETINNNVTNGLGLDYVQSQWELINKNADMYLDKINQMQGIRSIEKKYVDAINATNSAAAQQKINKLMQEELDDLNSRDKLSQYDLDRAEKKYQILLAQIALEEAQANKSEMRLRRDSQGNYSYQFVANNDEINKARDEVEKLYSDLYNFDKDAYRNNLEEAQNIYIEWQEKRKEINLTYANDEEELKRQTALLDEEYQSLITGITSQNLVIRTNLQESAFQDLAYLENKDLESFTNMTEAEKNALMEDLVPQWKSGTQEMLDVLMNPQTGFTKIIQDVIDETEGAITEYQERTAEASAAAGENFDEIKKHSDPAADSIDRLKTNTEKFFESIVDNLLAMENYTEQIEAQVLAFNAMSDALDAATRSHQLWVKEQEEVAKAAESQSALTGNGGNQSTDTNTNSGAGVSQNAGGGDGNLTVGETVTFVGGRYYGDSYGGGGSGSRGPGKKVKVTIVKNDNRPYPIHVESRDSAFGWVRKDQLTGYDTGGYTGSWDNSGRLAMLHQKELVLNAQDTENMLNTVSIMRTLAYSLGASVLERLAGVSASAASGSASSTGALEQNVHIDAQFPNVHDSAEIENALNNLINAASQRIYERK